MLGTDERRGHAAHRGGRGPAAAGGRPWSASPTGKSEIITLRFGLGGGREQTQKEVADRLGISQSYISRLEKRIIDRLKKEILKVMEVP